MRISEAPPAGWYPDPTGGTRLRWWDGTDWTDGYRSRPNLAAPGTAAATAAGLGAPVDTRTVLGAEYRRLADDVVTQARQAARAEVDRAADVFGARVREATRELQPLISQYTNRVFRWLKLLAIVAVVLVIAWFVFELVAQATFFDWLGDRIDSIGAAGHDPLTLTSRQVVPSPM